MKKKRDQKSNFLRQEQLRRAKEEAEIRRQLEQEAIRFQQEALEKERSRLASEKERREKEKTMYAESLAATRARRELSRTGGLVSSNMSNPNSLLVPSASSTSLRDTERNKPPPSEPRRSSRLPHDAPPSLSIPRREASEFASQLNMPASFTTNHFSDSSSPDSSRPSSLAYSPSSPSYPYSRPPSTYSAHTSSSEDVRHQSGSKRNSLAASSTAPMYARAPMIASYPTWSGSNPHIQYIPPVPPFPDYVTDMPLLPPTAPFMKHSRQRSPSSSSRKDSSPAPSTQSSRRGSFNSSSDHVNTVAPKSSGSSLRAPSLSPRPPQQRHASTPTKPTHERRPSGESRMTSHTQRSSNTHRQQQPQMRPPLPSSHSHSSPARGRPEQPAWTQVQAQYMQAAGNPWMTGMPVMVPVSPAMYMGMPVYQYPLMPVMGGQMVLNPTQGMPLAMGGDQRRGSGGTPGEGSTTGGGRSQMHGIIS
ncbi:hypothetical protein BDN70DRAFT_627307 [Pholiota conissans]|uniref:Uncharacterized protein n=1 Tax=Pholiota conissans TaxID=109636 RepID=A0A9P6D666_9AGAR|nr:hypothetical protein BDN70DRAFT_627307 [Pholiota conissans]